MSLLLIKKIKQALIEMFINAQMHGGCKFVFSSGQHYPQKYKLCFTIADIGITVKDNVSRFLDKPVSGTAAVEWAVEHNHTTRTIATGVPGGLGLSLLRDFVSKNEGRMQIVSADGYWEQSGSKITTAALVGEFPGTVVNLEFNLADTSRYCLVEELKR